jgi:PilZ domain
LNGRTAVGVASPLDWANAALKNNGSWERNMPNLDEKRGTHRQPILKAGTISFDGSGIDCLVRNMSGEGANLEVESQIGIPNSFGLIIDSEHSNHQCHVVWRKARRIGVAFD